MPVHRNRVEITHLFAIAQAQATPETGFAAAGDQCGGPAGLDTLVAGPVAGNVLAAGAGQARDDLFLGASVDTQESRNVIALVFGHDRALAGKRVAGHHCHGQAEAAGETAGAAVGTGQHHVRRVDPRVFVDVQFSVCQDEQGGKQETERCERQHGHQHAWILASISVNRF